MLLRSESASSTSWTGSGFNPEGTFGDMSNLYGGSDRLRGTAQESAESSESALLSETDRKLVRRANIHIRVENLEAADEFISGLLRTYNAYSASTNITENSNYYSLRVPAHLYDSFLSEMNGIGRVIRRSESTEDVTLRYHELEGRLESRRQLLRTFQSYLGRTNISMTDILTVETRIANLMQEIENTGSQLRHLANRVDYATIELTLSTTATSMQIQGASLGERLKGLFGNFGYFLSTVTVVITGIVIFGIPLLLLLALLFWVLFGRLGLIRKMWVLIKGEKQEG
jgi:hypothetical protein